MKVYVSEQKFVCISQGEYMGDDCAVIIHPTQIDLLIEWLKEAKKEALEP